MRVLNKSADKAYNELAKDDSGDSFPFADDKFFELENVADDIL